MHQRFVFFGCTDILFHPSSLSHQCPMWQGFEGLPDEKLLRGQWKKQNHTPYHGLIQCLTLRKEAHTLKKHALKTATLKQQHPMYFQV